jgi:glutamate-ammonia-ligase adenylyltransferase
LLERHVSIGYTLLMIATYEELTPSALAPFGFDDPVQACHLLQGMAGHDVPDRAFEAFLGVALRALAGSADPDRAVANLGRWAAAVGSRASRYGLMAAYPAAAEMLVTVFAASQFFADLLIANPEYLEVLTNPTIRDRGRDAEALWGDLTRRVAIAKTPNAKRDALRRFKPPEILRIGVRDLLGFADMPETARAISDFADACVRMAVQISTEERGLHAPPFAVFALGKLGGQELNYASDIDLIFVHGDAMPTGEAVKLGEAVRDSLAKATDAGFVFRVDLRLRPEGRFGPVSRSLESCRAYYESWAEPWERQALMKARFVAGDPGVGAAFAEMAEAFVYRARVEESFVESIRRNKRQLEQKIARAGESEINVKEGVGGIRDIEFTAQLLQLVAGGAQPKLRGGSTLPALEALAAAGLLTGAERSALRESYIFLRVVEHRLQLRDELPVRNLPDDPGEMRRFGRRLGYPDGAVFWADYQRHTARVRLLFDHLFYGGSMIAVETSVAPLTEWALAPDDPAASAALSEALAARGFADIPTALDRLRRSVSGSQYGGISPESRAAFAALVPALLDGAGQTTDPDAALRGLDALADAVPSRAALYQTLSESASLLPRLCQLAAGSSYLWQMLLGHLELLDLLADDETMDAPPSLRAAASLAEAAAQARRARLQTGARDLWELAGTTSVMAEVTEAAQATLESVLQIARRELNFTGRFAVIGLGKLGGGELGYGSDLDVLYVADAGELAAAARLAERAQRLLKDELGRFGFRYEMDARLRPEGRKGQLVLDLESYRAYYAHAAATWERQALLKSRPVAGESALGREFMALAEAVAYGTPLSDPQADEIRTMKRRIENERLKDPNDLKLGPGGLADIEWSTQLLQLKYGPRCLRLRTPGTVDALRRLRDEALVTQADWETLSETYLRLSQLRNYLYLKAGVSADVPPKMPEDLAALRVAARAVCLRLFYSARDCTPAISPSGASASVHEIGVSP